MLKAIGHSFQNRLLGLPKNIQVGQQPEQLANFIDYSKWKTGFLYSLYVTVLCSYFEKAVCQVGEADIQGDAPACRTSSMGVFCTLLVIVVIIIIITVRRTFVQISLVQQPSFRYRFRAICWKFWKFRKCRYCVLIAKF